jgi:uracil phosphoribosyltransferase
MRLVAEDALAELPCQSKSIATPCVEDYASGVERLDPGTVCAVSIIRSGDALLEAVREVEPAVKVGKILIQRDESRPDKAAVLMYNKLPPNIRNMHVLLCDPMLATGGSAIKAIEVLCKAGVDPAKIVFATMLCAPEGLDRVTALYPMIRIVTASVDDSLNEEKYIVPGLGDYGDRFFNTL